MRIPLCPAPTLISIVPDLVLSYGLALACALSYNSSNIGKHDPPTSTHHQLWIMQISKGTSLSRNSMSLSVLLFLTSFIRNSFVLVLLFLFPCEFPKAVTLISFIRALAEFFGTYLFMNNSWFLRKWPLKREKWLLKRNSFSSCIFISFIIFYY